MIQDMTRGKPWKLILFFSIPLLIGNIFQQIYGMADAMIVGRFVSVEALAAVGSTGAVNFLVLGFVIGLTSGFSIITAQRFGAGDENGVRKSVATSIWLCVMTMVIITTISVLTAEPLLRLMNTPDDIIKDATAYITIIFIGIPATMYYNMIAGVLRALGDSKTPLYFLIVSSILNVVLDLVFIICFHMGAAGAGYATVISQLVSAILCTVYSAKKYPILKMSREDFRLEGGSVKAHLLSGIPMALQFSITAIGAMVLQGALNAFGSKVIAAFTAANKVEMLVTQPFAALSVTMATYCGQNKGAGQMDRIRLGSRSAVLIGAGACIIASLINVFCGKMFTGLFLNGVQADILQYSQQYLNIIAIFYPFLGLICIFRSVLQGMGEALIPMLGGIAELVARFVIAITLPGIWGFAGICLASPGAWIAASVPLMIKYFHMMKKYKGQEKALMNENQNEC